MTMLTHTRGRFERTAHSSGRQGAIGTAAAKAHPATIKRFCICALTLLAAGGALAAIIALKAAIYVPRFNY
jgi:hypothetical protein